LSESISTTQPAQAVPLTGPKQAAEVITGAARLALPPLSNWMPSPLLSWMLLTAMRLPVAVAPKT